MDKFIDANIAGMIVELALKAFINKDREAFEKVVKMSKYLIFEDISYDRRAENETNLNLN